MHKPVLVISEIGVNHNGDMDLAKEMIAKSAESGADAVKFQSYKTEKLVTRTVEQADYQARNIGQDKTDQFEMLSRLELSPENHRDLKEYADSCGIEFMSSPFDEESLELLVSLDVQRIKIASGEGQNGPLLLKIGRTAIPSILSTGMGTLQSIEQSLKILSYGYQGTDKKVSSFQEFEDFYQTSQAKTLLQEKVSILHCTTNYPAALDEINLRAMETIRKQFDLPVGYSDHTDGMLVPVAAVAAGAIIIEKHFTTDCDLPGPDHKASIEPEDFKEMISLIRQVETALGNNIKTPTESELNIQKVACKKIVAAKTILAGEIITEDAITTKRTGEEGGLVAHKYWDILGLRAKEGIKQDQTITPDVLG